MTISTHNRWHAAIESISIKCSGWERVMVALRLAWSGFVMLRNGEVELGFGDKDMPMINATTSGFKTERANALNDARDSIGISRMVCLAASDYKRAKENPRFADMNGGVDALRHDLFLFIERWQKKLEAET